MINEIIEMIKTVIIIVENRRRRYFAIAMIRELEFCLCLFNGSYNHAPAAALPEHDFGKTQILVLEIPLLREHDLEAALEPT